MITDRRIVKVCGMRNDQNVREVIGLSPDLIGFIFYEGSPRAVDQANPIVRSTTGSARRVGVFVNEKEETIQRIRDSWELDVLQLHGNESAELCDSFRTRLGCEVWKAIPVRDEFPVEEVSHYEGACDLFLFDTKGEGGGGTGIRFNWNVLEHYTGRTRFMLAGGIGPQTVELLKSFNHDRWRGIDFSSCVEREPGIKDVTLTGEVIRAFREIERGREIRS